jgi:outer membrane protein assembly factor BamB
MVTDAGIVNCVDAKTGDEVWHGRIDGTYSASPILADGKIYFFSELGKTTVLAPGREFKVLGESQLPDGIMATPAIAGDALFIRTKTSVYRIQK